MSVGKFYMPQSARWEKSYFAYKYVKINRGTLNNVIKSDPLATDPKWYFINLAIACRTGESVGFL